MSFFRFLTLLALFAALIAFSACGDDDDNDDNDDDTSPADDDDDDHPDDDMVDGITSASPKVDSAALKTDHTGWRNPDCLSCHERPHHDGYLGGECVSCHGSNGAPTRPDGHATADCGSGHANSHPGLNFVDEKHCTACHKFASDSECPVTEEADVVVIGAGGGGLAAAATLALAGMDVVLIEKQYKVGGYMTNFRRGDYRFESSLHAMGGFDEFDELRGTRATFTALDIMDRVEPLKADPMYRSIFPEVTIDLPADRAAYIAMLKQMYPHEAEGIDALFADMEGCYWSLEDVMAISEEFSVEALLEILQELPQAINLLRYMFMPLKQMVAQYISDPELVGIFTQLVTYLGLGPAELQALYFIVTFNSYHMEGFYYFTGGSQSVSDAQAAVIEENGGRLRLNTLATKIDIQDNRAVRVHTLNDACYNTRYVISNANAPDTLLNMVGAEYLPADYVAKLNDMEIGVATFSLFLGVDHDYTDLFAGSHEWMINESVDNDQNFQWIKNGDIDRAPFIIANYTVIDPTTAPAGKNAIVVTTYMPYDMQEAWRWNEGYDRYVAFKEEVGEKLLDRVEEYLPGIDEHLEVFEVGAPVTNWAYALNPSGTIFGWANTVDQGTLRRLQQQTPIDNLILAGAWTFPGGGQSAVIQSGVAAAEMVLEQEAAKR